MPRPKLLTHVPNPSLTDESQTPLEPFHLQDLPSRIGAAGVATCSPLAPSASEASCHGISPDVNGSSQVDRGMIELSTDSATPENSSSSEVSTPTSLHVDITSSSSASIPSHQTRTTHLPQAQGLRNNVHVRKPSSLATIPEVSPLTPASTTQNNGFGKAKIKTSKPAMIPPMTPDTSSLQAYKSRTSNLSIDVMRGVTNEASSTKRALASTTPSLSHTSPTFHHGSIRRTIGPAASARSSMPPLRGPQLRRRPKEREETLDRSAFQMAIAGGTGDHLMSGDVGSVHAGGGAPVEEVDIDEIRQWWAGFGIEMGGLVDAHAQAQAQAQAAQGEGAIPGHYAPRMPSHRGACMTAELADTQPVPPAASRPRRTCRLPARRIASTPQQMQQRHTQPKEARPDDPQTVPDAAAARDAAQEPDDDDDDDSSEVPSPPDSPMQDVLPRAAGAPDVVPMGFNLTHDLDDFLRWEAEHVERIILGGMGGVG
ncbi:MAG: hypothetical protein M1818_002011 [Claussenomyces sp. TS43310]|nr:MAG: hypothetical protein M1818_002011 [Claussenomyces sp. TS43310]